MKVAVAVLGAAVIVLAWYSWTMNSRLDDLEGSQTDSESSAASQEAGVNPLLSTPLISSSSDAVQRDLQRQIDGMQAMGRAQELQRNMEAQALATQKRYEDMMRSYTDQ